MPSTSKTKSGERFRAPTDQARKMDRKKENKRNKKDRQQIRQAMAKYCNLDETTSKLLVLERQILGLDPQPFHIDVLKKKQKVLTDSINKRRLTLQQSKDDTELKKFNEKINVYQTDCQRLAVLAQQARLAREADPDSIPLPMGEMSSFGPERHSQLLAPSMIKRKVEFQLPPRPPRAGLKPPGPPCGYAPNFSDSEEEDDHQEEHYDDGDLAPVPIPDFDNPYPPQQMHRNFGPPSSYHQMPPRMPTYHPHSHSYNPMGFQHHHEDAVISSAPQITRNQESAAPATLSAAPELRNLRRETVKLVPAQLLRRPATSAVPRPPAPVHRRPEAQKQAKNTDEAYNEFMKELDGLI
ncbi:unnamed protein product [Caenorhabditis sp. 36 PRJEB53466]|nr:unnamed protein product [Caenorhabditis sp. 36 PRJEB53466]